MNTPEVGTEITTNEWDLLSKVTPILKTFYEATLMLSKKDASISMVIPLVTVIIHQLKVTPKSKADHGVKALKRGLSEAMSTRFADIESSNYYSENKRLIRDQCRFQK